MSDQANLPGQSPEQLRVLEVKAKLVAFAREISALDVHAFANAAARDTWEEELAVAALDFKRRLRQTGVFAQLAIEKHQEREAKARA